jgi:hypothetical protein
VAMQHERQVTARPFVTGENVEFDNKRLNVASGSSYNFTQAITAGFTLSFTQNKDLKTAITQRGLSVAVNGQFRF